MNRLEQLLSTMDIPSMRRNTDNDANARWLLRNLHINNANHPNLDEALFLLRKEIAPFVGE